MAETGTILHNQIQYYEELASTNLKALELAKQGAAGGTVVVAARQTAGRGRMRRKWESPEGKGLWFSMILRPTIAAEYCAQITLLAAVAVAQALQRLTDKNFSIKWPNDIMLDGKKSAVF
ncbi:MAG: biotin--[acetyl-CoA-carboxylase] ligase [Acidaminococcaceae bacterium]|nr:biotin--[acetyl-CoA-carboxylase] ligase [Acidaminococcaceae bacterium]